jgi:hypothetical protein
MVFSLAGVASSASLLTPQIYYFQYKPAKFSKKRVGTIQAEKLSPSA